MSGYGDVTDGFHMNPMEFQRTWKLTDREITREIYSGRLQIHGRPMPNGGYEDCQFYLPSLRAWIARTAEMPARVQRKVREAGGAEQLDRFRQEQIDLCQIDPIANAVTLPDGTVWRDIILVPAVKQ